MRKPTLKELPAIAANQDLPRASESTPGLGDFAPHLSREDFLAGYVRCCLYAQLLAKRGLEDGRTGEDAVSDILLRMFQAGYVAPWSSGSEMLRALRPKIRREIWRAWRAAKVRRRPFESIEDPGEDNQIPARRPQ